MDKVKPSVSTVFKIFLSSPLDDYKSKELVGHEFKNLDEAKKFAYSNIPRFVDYNIQKIRKTEKIIFSYMSPKPHYHG